MIDKELIQKIHSRPHFPENVESLAEHLSRFCAEDGMTVFHEFLSLDFHLDVYLIDRKKDNFKMLITSGMSLLEMHLPDQVEDKEQYSFAELMILIPKDMTFAEVHTGAEENSWVISMLKESARFPHHYDTWLSIGHTLQATYDMDPYDEDTDFVGCAVLPSVTFDSDFTEFRSEDRKINIYSLFPLYQNEMEYKIANGFNSLLDLLIKYNVPEILNPNRENLIK